MKVNVELRYNRDMDAKAAATQFADLVLDQYDLTSDDEVEDKDGWFEVHPMNPPYDDPEYVAPFVDDLVEMLGKLGFKRHGVSHVTRTMRCGSVEARIENVDDDRPIHVEFHDVS